MKFLVATNFRNGQTVYIPIKRINSIRYPSANGKTLIVWDSGDGSIPVAEV